MSNVRGLFRWLKNLHPLNLFGLKITRSRASTKRHENNILSSLPGANRSSHAGPATRAVRVEEALASDPAASLLIFYGGVVEIGVDENGQLVGCVFRGDLHPDEPLFCPGHEDAKTFTRLQLDARLPIHLLRDRMQRILGVHIVGHSEAKRIYDLNPNLLTAQQRQEFEALKIRAPEGRWPDTAEEFGMLMELIDGELRDKRVPIASRPMRAIVIASQRLKKNLYLVAPDQQAQDETYTGHSFVNHLHRWYQERYADRLAMNLSSGEFAIELRGDVWKGVLPQIYGGARPFAHRTIPSERKVVSGRPVNYNVLDCISGLTDALRFQLTEVELQAIYEQSIRAVRAYNALEVLRAHRLAKAARSDLDLCVSNLLGSQPHYGQARWSALQAVEKVLKLALTVTGATYDRDHKLDKLNSQLKDAGYASVRTALLQDVKCSAGVRYDDVPSTFAEAMAAQAAALEIVADVAEEIEGRGSPSVSQ